MKDTHLFLLYYHFISPVIPLPDLKLPWTYTDIFVLSVSNLQMTFLLAVATTKMFTLSKFSHQYHYYRQNYHTPLYLSWHNSKNKEYLLYIVSFYYVTRLLFIYYVLSGYDVVSVDNITYFYYSQVSLSWVLSSFLHKFVKKVISFSPQLRSPSVCQYYNLSSLIMRRRNFNCLFC